MNAPPGKLLTVSAYARTRKARGLSGGSHTAVRKAIDQARLHECIHAGEKGGILIFPELADEEWRLNTHPGKGRPPGSTPGRAVAPAPTLFEEDNPRGRPPVGSERAESAAAMRTAATEKAHYAAGLARLEYERRDGTLVVAADVEAEAFKLARQVRNELERIPNRVSAIVAAMSDVHAIRQVLEDEVRDVLKSLGGAETERRVG